MIQEAGGTLGGHMEVVRQEWERTVREEGRPVRPPEQFVIKHVEQLLQI